MEVSRAVEIVSILADGIDPYTGEPLGEGSPYQHADTVRALFLALGALERAERAARRRKELPANAGKPWTEGEEGSLAVGFDAGRTVKQLALEHQRTEGAITSRLVRLGKIQPPGDIGDPS